MRSLLLRPEPSKWEYLPPIKESRPDGREARDEDASLVDESTSVFLRLEAYLVTFSPSSLLISPSLRGECERALMLSVPGSSSRAVHPEDDALAESGRNLLANHVPLEPMFAPEPVDDVLTG